jgi:branched-chain amino acid aminotransferase
VFEGIRAYETQKGPAIFRLEEHVDRLIYSAKKLFMDIPFSKDEIINAIKDVIKINNLKSAYIRPIVFYGDDSMGLNPLNNDIHIAIIAWEWGKYLADEVRVKFSSIKRISELTTAVDAKISGHYINSIFATLEAKRLGYDEALLLDHNGYIAEGPGENIFFVKNNIITTPLLGKILKGITRDSVLKIAENLGYEIVERNILPEEINSFNGAFFTGTAAEITPISEISGTQFDLESAKDIREKFFETIHAGNEEFQYWLTFIEDENS